MERGAGRRQWPPRARIVGWLLTLVGFILVAHLLVVAQVLGAQNERTASGLLEDEYTTFAAFVRESDPLPPTVDGVLSAYLATTVPNRAETYFSIVDAQAHRRTDNDPPLRLDLDEGFIAQAAAASTPVIGTHSADGVTAHYAVIPVVVPGDEHTGALVVVQFPDGEATRWTLTLLAASSLGALVLAGLASWFVAGRVLRPLQDVSETAARISDSDLTQRIEVRGDDDVADLARSFNHMLDRLETAFEGQRQFLDDAGHELRTPITVVRGQLEVLGDDPHEREQVFPLVLGELDRMGRIVDDLLSLARAQRPDFLVTTPVDVADLTLEVLAKARALDPDRRWTLSHVAPVTAILDGQRMTQALMQLAANAVAATEPGATIGIGSRYKAGTLTWWVLDDGPGIAEEDQDRIFERFVSGGRAPGSTGLGLAIVRGIIEAHGGRVTLTSHPGHGARFELVLPAPELVGEPLDDDDDTHREESDGADTAPAAAWAADAPAALSKPAQPATGA